MARTHLLVLLLAATAVAQLDSSSSGSGFSPPPPLSPAEAAARYGNHTVNTAVAHLMLPPQEPPPNPDLQWGAYFTAAVTLESEGKHEEAVRYFRWAIAQAPDEPSPYVRIGLLQRYMSKWDPAIRCLLHAARLGASRAHDRGDVRFASIANLMSTLMSVHATPEDIFEAMYVSAAPAREYPLLSVLADTTAKAYLWWGTGVPTPTRGDWDDGRVRMQGSLRRMATGHAAVTPDQPGEAGSASSHWWSGPLAPGAVPRALLCPVLTPRGGLGCGHVSVFEEAGALMQALLGHAAGTAHRAMRGDNASSVLDGVEALFPLLHAAGMAGGLTPYSLSLVEAALRRRVSGDDGLRLPPTIYPNGEDTPLAVPGHPVLSAEGAVVHTSYAAVLDATLRMTLAAGAGESGAVSVPMAAYLSNLAKSVVTSSEVAGADAASAQALPVAWSLASSPEHPPVPTPLPPGAQDRYTERALYGSQLVVSPPAVETARTSLPLLLGLFEIVYNGIPPPCVAALTALERSLGLLPRPGSGQAHIVFPFTFQEGGLEPDPSDGSAEGEAGAGAQGIGALRLALRHLATAAVANASVNGTLPPPLVWPSSSAARRRPRLRLAYTSSDLRTHSVGFHVLGLVAAHDRQQVDVSCYNIGNIDVHAPSSGTERRAVWARVDLNGTGHGSGTHEPAETASDRINDALPAPLALGILKPPHAGAARAALDTASASSPRSAVWGWLDALRRDESWTQTERFVAACDAYVGVPGCETGLQCSLGNREAGSRVAVEPAVAAHMRRVSGAHVAVDLNGRSQGNAANVWRAGPAPVTLSYLGTPVTVASPDTLHLMVTDAYVAPPDATTWAPAVPPAMPFQLPATGQSNEPGVPSIAQLRDLAPNWRASTPIGAGDALGACGIETWEGVAATIARVRVRRATGARPALLEAWRTRPGAGTVSSHLSGTSTSGIAASAASRVGRPTASFDLPVALTSSLPTWPVYAEALVYIPHVYHVVTSYRYTPVAAVCERFGRLGPGAAGAALYHRLASTSGGGAAGAAAGAVADEWDEGTAVLAGSGPRAASPNPLPPPPQRSAAIARWCEVDTPPEALQGVQLSPAEAEAGAATPTPTPFTSYVMLSNGSTIVADSPEANEGGSHSPGYAVGPGLMGTGHAGNAARYDPGDDPPACPPGAELVIAAFHTPSKIEPRILDSWVRIVIGGGPCSVLWVLRPRGQDDVGGRLVEEMVARGLPRSRVKQKGTRYGRDSRTTTQPLYAAIHLFLDAHVYGAHSTAPDLLAAGVPVLTLVSGEWPGRVGAGMLQALVPSAAMAGAGSSRGGGVFRPAPPRHGLAPGGAPDAALVLVTHSYTEYEETGLRLVRRPVALLARLAARLAAASGASLQATAGLASTTPSQSEPPSSLFDFHARANDLQRAYRAAYEWHALRTAVETMLPPPASSSPSPQPSEPPRHGYRYDMHIVVAPSYTAAGPHKKAGAGL